MVRFVDVARGRESSTGLYEMADENPSPCKIVYNHPTDFISAFEFRLRVFGARGRNFGMREGALLDFRLRAYFRRPGAVASKMQHRWHRFSRASALR